LGPVLPSLAIIAALENGMRAKMMYIWNSEQNESFRQFHFELLKWHVPVRSHYLPKEISHME
jgi:hypothetical protein